MQAGFVKGGRFPWIGKNQIINMRVVLFSSSPQERPFNHMINVKMNILPIAEASNIDTGSLTADKDSVNNLKGIQSWHSY